MRQRSGKFTETAPIEHIHEKHSERKKTKDKHENKSKTKKKQPSGNEPIETNLKAKSISNAR